MLFVLNRELKIPLEYIIPKNRTQPEPQRIKWPSGRVPEGEIVPKGAPKWTLEREKGRKRAQGCAEMDP